MTHELDDQIRAALEAEDAELLARYDGDAPIHQLLIEMYQGRRRWINVIATIGTFVLFAIVCFCGYQFFQAETTRNLIAWATGFVTIFIWLALMKIWFWLEINKNAITREVKRLELQVALLNSRADEATH